MQKFKSTKKLISIVLVVMLVLSTVVVGVNATTNVKVAFTNNKGWSKVYVYAWDSNDDPLMGDWPGTQITNSAQNDLGETVFYTEIPSNTAGLVFCESANGQQTVDISFSGQPTGWYMTNKSGNTWQVATWNYNPDGQTDQPTSGSKTIYFTNTKGWSNIKAHAWDKNQNALLGNWPGTSMTWDSKNSQNQDIYKITIPESAVGVVFSNNGGAQTVDIVAADNTGYYPQSQNSQGKWICGSWSPVKEIATTAAPTTAAPTTVAPTTIAPTTVAPTTVKPTTVQPTTAAPTTVPGGSKTVYFKNTENWSKAYVFAWDSDFDAVLGDWPGTAMTFAYTDGSGNDVYSVTVPENAVGICFTDNGDDETVDVVPQDGVGYYIDSLDVHTGKWALGQWNVDSEPTEAKPSTAEPSTAEPSTDEPTVDYKTFYFAVDSSYDNVVFYGDVGDVHYHEKMTLVETDYYGKNIYKATILDGEASILVDWDDGDNTSVYFNPKNGSYYYPKTKTDTRNMWRVEEWEYGTVPWDYQRVYYFAFDPDVYNITVTAVDSNEHTLLYYSPMTLAADNYHGKKLYSIVIPEDTVRTYIYFHSSEHDRPSYGDLYVISNLTDTKTTYYYVTKYWDYSDCDIATFAPGTAPWEDAEPTTEIGERKYYLALSPYAYNVKVMGMNRNGLLTIPYQDMTLEQTDYYGKNIYSVVLTEFTTKVNISFNNGLSYSLPTLTSDKTEYYYVTKLLEAPECEIGTWSPGNIPWDYQETTAELPTVVPDGKIHFALNTEAYNVKIFIAYKNSSNYAGDNMTIEQKHYHGMNIYSYDIPDDAENYFISWYDAGNMYSTVSVPFEGNTYGYPANSVAAYKWDVGAWAPGTAPWETTDQIDPVNDKKVYLALDPDSHDIEINGFDINRNVVYRYRGDELNERVSLAEQNYYGKKIYCVTFPKDTDYFTMSWRSGGNYYLSNITKANKNNIRYYFDGEEEEYRAVLKTWEQGTAPWVVYEQPTMIEPITVENPQNVTSPMECIYIGSTFRPTSYSLSLKDNIAINFRVKPETVEGYSNLYLKVYYNDEEEEIHDYTTLSDGTLVFQFDKILPQSAGEAATAVLYGEKDGALFYGDEYSKSVLEYADKYQVSGSSSLKGLLVNLLRYCAEAQKFTGNNVENLVSDHIVHEAERYAKKTLDPMEDVKNYHAEPCPNNATSEFKSAALVLGSNVGIKLSFTADDISDKSIRVDYNGESKYFDASDLTDEGNDRGSFIYNLYANQLHDTIKFTVCEGTTPISDTMTYSAASYAGKYVDNDSVGPLLTELMLYGQAAEYYANNP